MAFPAPRKPLVLIVDDDDAVRASIKRLLNMMGYDVVDVGSGPEALAGAAQKRPDMILLDVSMPAMNGIQTLGELHNKGIQSTVIMLGDNVDLSAAQEALNYGARDVLSKPVTLPALKKVLQTYLPIR